MSSRKGHIKLRHNLQPRGRAIGLPTATRLLLTLALCPLSCSASSKVLTFGDRPYAETPLPANYGSDEEVSLTWRREGQFSAVSSTGESPFQDRSPDGPNRFLVAQGVVSIAFNPTVRIIKVFVRDNEPDFLDRSVSRLTVKGQLQDVPVFSATVDFVPADHSGVWMQVAGKGAIDTLFFISHDDFTRSYLIDDLEFEIYSETEVIALAGRNQSVLEGTTVTLDGTSSVNATSFSWVQIKTADHPDVLLSSPTHAITTFLAPYVTTAATLAFQLTASGPFGSDTDTVEVTVNISKPPATSPNSLTALPLETERSLGAIVEWDFHPDATKYIVHRSQDNPDNSYVKIAPSITSCSYEDNWLEEGTIYFYRVSAANQFGEGPSSDPIPFVARRNLAFDADAIPTARILNPTGTGLKDIRSIANSVKNESYDSYHGGPTEREDWYGYIWQNPRYFDSIVYYEGKSFRAGGWWTSLTAQYTTDGVTWKQVEELTISPLYKFHDSQDGRSDFTRFHLTFNRCRGIGIRIYGEPGGVADFTSVAELEVYGDQAPNIVIPNAGPDLHAEEGTSVTLHGENSLNAEQFLWEQVRTGSQPEVILTAADTPNPTFLVEDVATNTPFTFRLTVTGFHGPKSDAVTVTVVNKEPPGLTQGLTATGGHRSVSLAWQPNNDATSYKVLRRATPQGTDTVVASGITATGYVDTAPDLRSYHTYYYRVVAANDYGQGPPSNAAPAKPIENFALYRDATPFALITNPTGTGQKDINIIRNGIHDEIGYDSYDGPNPAPEDWYGYLWSDCLYPDTVVYTMGKNYLDGGWWTSLTVQYTPDGTSWLEAPNLKITPYYNFENYYAASPPRPNYSRYTLTFDRVRALGLRIYGQPGGIAQFSSVVELEVYGLDAPVACKRTVLPPFYTPGQTATVTLSVEIHEPPAPASLTITELLPEEAVLVDAGGGNASVPGQITWDFGPGQVVERELTYTIAIQTGLSAGLSFEGWLSYGTIGQQRIRGQNSLYPKPLPPQNLRLDMTLAGHLRWSPILQEGVAGYHVYRSVNSHQYVDISGLITHAFFDDLDVQPGVSYRYKVSMENASAVQSDLAESPSVGPASVVMNRREIEDYNYGGGLFPGGQGRSGVRASTSDDLSPGTDFFFHSAVASNTYRPDDPIDIRQLRDGGYFVAGAAEGDWWRFGFQLPQAGYVRIADLRVSSSAEATYDFFWDESPVGRFSFNTRGEANWHSYQMDIPPFLSSAGLHTLRIRATSGVSNADSFGIGFGWSPPARELIFSDDFDRYDSTAEVTSLGKWNIVNGSGEPNGAWRLWDTSGRPLAAGEPGPDFPGFLSGYMVSNGDFAGNVHLDEQLVSPEIDCSSFCCVAVQFATAINIYEQDREGDLQTSDFDISFYDEASQSWSDWINLSRHDRNSGDHFSAIPQWFDVSPLADGRKVVFRWHFYNTYWDYWWAVDDVRVTGEKRPPKVVSATISSPGMVSLSWEDFGENLYTVEYADDLTAGFWKPVPGTQWPIPQTSWQGDNVSQVRSRFYRVKFH